MTQREKILYKKLRTERERAFFHHITNAINQLDNGYPVVANGDLQSTLELVANMKDGPSKEDVAWVTGIMIMADGGHFSKSTTEVIRKLISKLRKEWGME